MARFGNKPVEIPNGVTVNVAEDKLIVKGSKGEIEKVLPRGIKVEVSENVANIATGNLRDKKLLGALQGTFRSHLVNMIHGVTEGWSKSLEVVGAGYRASTGGNKLTLIVGYSHPVDMEIPAGLEVSVEKQIITISGVDKDMVGQFAANVRATRKPEPYKGSGIKYTDEVIRRKAGKQATGGGA